MDIARPEPGAELHQGPATVPRPAATVILLKGGSETLQVLLVQRNPQARFMGGAWVFPGGSVDRHEGSGQPALRAAALRELAEEAGIVLSDPDQLVPFARWITPAQVRTRFDTWFYLAPAAADTEALVDGSEVIDARWYGPAGALAASERGDLFLVFPTIKQLQQLAGFPSANALLTHARSCEVQPVEPQVLMRGETARIVLPGEPGYQA
ncbi:MAG: NUDIX hydrolase [Solirubrobacteraceae bacterium]